MNEDCYYLRKITIKLNETDYLDFLKASNGYNLTVEEKIQEIINYYVIIERKRTKYKISSGQSTKLIFDNCIKESYEVRKL